MKIIIILGSPKSNGNTSKVLDKLEKLLTNQSHVTERINIVDHNVNGCIGCNICITDKNSANCVQKDEANAIFDKIQSADMVIYATPLYAHSFPAQMKAFIDRHYCLVTKAGLSDQTSILEGKRVALLVTCCNAEPTTNLIQEMFDRIFGELRCNIIGKYIVASSAAPDFIIRAEKIAQNISNQITVLS